MYYSYHTYTCTLLHMKQMLHKVVIRGFFTIIIHRELKFLEISDFVSTNVSKFVTKWVRYFLEKVSKIYQLRLNIL